MTILVPLPPNPLHLARHNLTCGGLLILTLQLVAFTLVSKLQNFDGELEQVLPGGPVGTNAEVALRANAASAPSRCQILKRKRNDYATMSASNRQEDLIRLHGQVIRLYQSRTSDGLPLVEENYPSLAWGEGIWEEGQNRTHFRSHYPLLNQQTLWDHADHIYQRGSYGWAIPTSSPPPSEVRNGDVIFVNQVWQSWILDVAPHIQATADVTLIIFDGDSYFCSGENQDRIRELGFVSRIFVPNACRHPKVTGLPLGLMDNLEHPNRADDTWTIHGDESKVASLLLDGATRTDKAGVYCDMDPENNPKERWEALEFCERMSQTACKENKVDMGSLALNRGRRPWEEYICDLSQHRFVISPEGNGYDCHRTWEALLVGSIPIIKRVDGMADLFDGLPVLIVDSWSNITEEILDTTWNDYIDSSLKRQAWSYEKLFAPYWIDLIRGTTKYSEAFNRYRDPSYE